VRAKICPDIVIFKTSGLLAARKPVANHVARDVTGKVTSAKSATSDAGGVAELVASGEGKSVHDGEDKGDDWHEMLAELDIQWMQSMFFVTRSHARGDKGWKRTNEGQP
jgi:hypothetical protein